MANLGTPVCNSNVDVFDPHGDVFFAVFSHSLDRQRLLRVSSKVLCLASPVFNAMLGPTSYFKEAEALRENQTALVTLGDDDADALVIVMNAAHSDGQSNPTRISFDLLYQIAVLCDKYDIAHVMRSSPLMWANKLTPFARRDGYERVLVVAWVFGLNLIFSHITREVINDWKPEKRQLGPQDERRNTNIHIVPDAIVGLYCPHLHLLRRKGLRFGGDRRD